MSLPETIQVLGVPFRIELVEFEEEGQCGECHGLLRVIKISSALDTKRQWTTLVHEFIHATLFIMGAATEISDSMEECIAQSLEHSIEQLIRQVGPELIKSYQD
jgi:hypothetical protein